MGDRQWDYVVVGSGAGGATVARHLAKRGKSVLVLERGVKETNTGTFRDSLRYYDTKSSLFPIPRKTREGVIIWHTFMAGGSTVVSCGNGTRCLETELASLGVNLESDFSEAEKEMQIKPIPERLLSDGSRSIRDAATELGYGMDPMPKFIEAKMCRKCGQCVLGCNKGAKWTALSFLEDAEKNGAKIRYRTRVQQVIVENGRAKGIKAIDPNGAIQINCGAVILAAGGLCTPVILQKSGFADVGGGLFADLLVNTYGVTKGLNQVHEPTMTLVNHEFHKSRGFILSPFVNHPQLLKFIELGPKGLAVSDKRHVGIMTKIVDEAAGRVFPDGSVSKPVTERDWSRLREGSRISAEILNKCGAKPIMVSGVQAGHPGGTAAIGKVIDKDMQTKVDGLFVCDASALPTAPGLPPILTIVALAKRLARSLP